MSSPPFTPPPLAGGGSLSRAESGSSKTLKCHDSGPGLPDKREPRRIKDSMKDRFAGSTIKDLLSSPKHRRRTVKAEARVHGQEFAIAQDYDYNARTCDAYRNTSPDAVNIGKYADIRNMLDTAYHGIYTYERQQLQDRLLDAVVSAGEGQAHPWLIYTAGAMGAGKSHVMNWMYDKDYFPIHEIVHVDADVFKTAMPEWEGYVAHDRFRAGVHTRRESGYLVEIAQAAAMLDRKHVWVDGSMRDGVWYKHVFNSIRSKYPAYRIAILHVTATEAAIFQRVASRGEETGRCIPHEEVEDSIRRVPKSVASLCPYIEFFAEIDNSDRIRITKYCDATECYVVADGNEHWDQIRDRFSSVPSPKPRWRSALGSTSVDSTASEMHGFSLSSGSFKSVSADWRLSEPLPFAVAQPVGSPFGMYPHGTKQAARASPSMGLDGSDSPPPEAAPQGGLPTSSPLRPCLLRGESAELERESNGISGFTSRFQRRATAWQNVRVMASVVHQLSKGARPMESPASPRGSSGAPPPGKTSG